jgi:hypothetical protein
LIDTLPDEASLAAMVAHEMSHVVLGHRIDTQYAFNDRLLFKDEETFSHFYFGRTKDEETAANEKALALMQNSPYKDQLGNAGRFLQALDKCSKEIPNLISPHLGDRVPVGWSMLGAAETAQASPAPAADPKNAKPAVVQIVALPLGSRVKMDPWSDRLEMLKAKPAGTIAEREKMPFEVTPIMPYLVRIVLPGQVPGSVATSSKDNPPPKQQP